MPSRTPSRERFSFANLDEVQPLPDLISIQRDSFRWFLEQGLADTFRDISPIEDFSGNLKLILEFDPTDQDLRPPPKFTVEECKEKDMTYAAPIFVRGPGSAQQRRDYAFRGGAGVAGGYVGGDGDGGLALL